MQSSSCCHFRYRQAGKSTSHGDRQCYRWHPAEPAVYEGVLLELKGQGRSLGCHLTNILWVTTGGKYGLSLNSKLEGRFVTSLGSVRDVLRSLHIVDKCRCAAMRSILTSEEDAPFGANVVSLYGERSFRKAPKWCHSDRRWTK